MSASIRIAIFGLVPLLAFGRMAAPGAANATTFAS
jgi:hypothetical protein